MVGALRIDTYMKPHEIKDTELQEKLAEAVLRTIQYLEHHERDGIIYGIISQASRFFAHCPGDFCVQHADWFAGHAVFGGTNRLLWSVAHGFRPDPSYCTRKFKEQFVGEFWEPIGELQCENSEIWLVGSHHLENVGVLPKVKVPLAWGGLHVVLGRKSNKGDGKLAEVRIFTGAEA